MKLKYLSPLLFILPLFFSCQSSGVGDKVADLEQVVATKPTAETIQKLLELYQADLSKTDVDVSSKAVTVGKLAQLQLKNNQAQAAVQTLKDGIGKYFATSSTADNVWAMGQIFQNQLNSPDIATTIQKLYKQNFPAGKNIVAINQVLAQDTTTLFNHLDGLGSKMYNEETHRLDAKAASDFIESCELFALLKPEDSKSPDYLHKAGETARAIRAFPRAISIYDRIYSNYPTFEKAPQSLFLKAFTYDNDLKDYGKARALYIEFLEKYPNDDFADDTQFLLKNLGKTDEEIIQSFSKEKKAN